MATYMYRNILSFVFLFFSGILFNSCGKFEAITIQNHSLDTVTIILNGTHYNRFLPRVNESELKKLTVGDYCPYWGEYDRIEDLAVLNDENYGMDSNYLMIKPIKEYFHLKSRLPYYRYETLNIKAERYANINVGSHPTVDELKVLFYYVKRKDSLFCFNDSIRDVIMQIPPQKQIRFQCSTSGDASCSISFSEICESITVQNENEIVKINTSKLDSNYNQNELFIGKIRFKIAN